MRWIVALFCVALCATGTTGFAQSDTSLHRKMTAPQDTLVDLSSMDVSPHELAFTQVLSEICPQFLNATQRQQFRDAYQKQLQALMPNLDPVAVMAHMNRQKDYKITLKGMRAWTMSFPKSENRELCVEFAETPVMY